MKPTTIDYVQDRDGKVIYRTDGRCALMGNCNAPDWNGGAMPRPPSRTRQLVDAMAAFQMVHVMEGVIMRGTATVLRDLNRPLFGKTGTTNGPTNVWFVGGTPDIVAGVYLGYDNPRPMGGWAQGGADIRADLEGMGADRAQGSRPRFRSCAPPGIRWVRIDRATGKPVFGAFPTTTTTPRPRDLGSVPAADGGRSHRHEQLRRSLQSRISAIAGRRRASRRRSPNRPSNRSNSRSHDGASTVSAGGNGTAATERLANPERRSSSARPERF